MHTGPIFCEFSGLADMLVGTDQSDVRFAIVRGTLQWQSSFLKHNRQKLTHTIAIRCSGVAQRARGSQREWAG